MDNNLFAKFNSMFDVEGLKADVEKSGASGDFEEIPKGNYEVKVKKLELGATSENAKNPNMPMGKVWYEIVAGDYKGQLIFQNQMLTNGFGIHMMNGLMISLESGLDIAFENFEQYAELMEKVAEAIKDFEYQLEYGENKKGYSTFRIVQKF